MEFNWRECYAMYINLDHREDRRVHIKQQLSGFDIIADRVRGVYYHEIEKPSPKFNYMASLSKGQVGCYTAHINCLERAYKLGQNALIFEDDAHLCSDFDIRMEYIQNYLNNNDWDIFWLGGTYHIEPTWHPVGHTNPNLKNCTCTIGKDVEKTDDARIVRTYGCWSTAGYIVKYESIPKILHMLEERLEESYAIDHNFIIIEPFLKTFAFVPALIKQIDNHSDNYNSINKFSEFATLGRYWYADNMEDVDPSSLNFI